TGAERVDLGGRLVVPAVLDAHLHVTESALRPAGVDLRGARNFPEIAERVRGRSGELGTGPVWGGGWDQDRLTERRMPSRKDLDAWLPDRPLMLSRVCEHVAVVNSVALELLGVDRTTEPIPGGTVDLDAGGEPTGILRERALRHLGKFPFPSLSDRPELGERFLARAASLGIAAFAGLRAGPQEVEWMRERLRGPGGEGGPRYRAFGGAGHPGEIEAWARVRRAGSPSVVGIKLFADGSFGARGAWLEAPYADVPEESGAPVQPPEDWDELIRTADALGLRVAAHALGDRGMRRVIEAFEAVRPIIRPRIEHGGLVPDALLPRLSRISADVVVQPGFRTSDTWLADRLGEARVRSAYRFASFRRRGIRLAGSSDAPVESLDPIDGIRSAVAVQGFGESLGPTEALELYTRGAAEVLEFPDLGHLEVGACASLVALPGRDLGGIPDLGPGAIRSVWLDGRPVPPPRL
ncbi:MAG: amidohydrolase, partial [Thermoplasmata archaeon]|nr:amidohydrolase [Thermoplasmata archaeon]